MVDDAFVAAGPGTRVLLIDDLPEMRRLVELWLEGTAVRVAAQAPSCEDISDDLIERHRPQVVVMDMHMPGRSGIECTRDLLARHPELKVVGFTSSDDPLVEQEMRAAGAVAHFHKSELQDLIRWLTAFTPEG
jgi:CheY-like chemotaxis protein